MPILFYAVLLLAFVTQQVSSGWIGLAWLYVLTRYTHTVIHLGANRLLWRLRVFVLSYFVLLGLWLWLLIKLVFVS